MAHPAALLVLLVFLLSTSLFAQKSSGKGKGPVPAMDPTTPPGYTPKSTETWFDPYRETTPGSPQPHLKNEQPACFHWPMSPLVSGVVTVDRLDLPAGARENFYEACAAVESKDLSEAQHGLNAAVKSAPRFAAAWVLLGQVQRDQGKSDEAGQSCARARDADASYLAAYLCLADLAARQNKWNEAAEATNLAIGLHPLRAPGAYYYNALAYFYLGQAPLAEKSALLALGDKGLQSKAPLHWLLAKIYEARKDRASEADQLREYLKLAPHAPDAQLARRILQQIEHQAASSSATAANPTPSDK
jgi:tetratricopeptide (TPR) repeat protein